MSKTPRTDAEFKLEAFFDGAGIVETVPVEFARQLETELADKDKLIEQMLKVSKMPKKDDAMKRLDFVLKIREAEKLEVVFETGKKVLCPVCQLLKITDGKVLIYKTKGSIRYCACKICKTLFNATGPAVEKKEKRKCLKCNTYRVFGRKIYCKKCLKENKKNTWRNYYLNKRKMNENEK